ncbi:MAG: hypothetical protein J07HX64_01526 [halophilic archaeon J07HX64]|nr:MAG: hypothetical protein J07HX64_01526 [halophilic archaeon J07HX64]
MDTVAPAADRAPDLPEMRADPRADRLAQPTDLNSPDGS